MFKSYVFKKEDFKHDFLDNLAFVLRSERMKQNFSLDIVCDKTKLSLLEVDGLECGMVNVDFRSLMKLLDFYEISLPFAPDCFPGLPQKWYAKYLLTDEDQKEAVKKCILQWAKTENSPLWKNLQTIIEDARSAEMNRLFR